MSAQLQTTSGDRLAGVMTYIPALDRTKVMHRLYDGSYMTQTVGRAAEYADVTLEATAEMMDEINEAEARGDLLAIVYKDATRYGYIEDNVKWQAIVPGAVYEGQMRFLIEGGGGV